MQILSLLTFGLTAAITSASPATTNDGQDWKYAHGWDGTTLPPIGTPVNSTNPGGLTALTVGGVYICTDVNWGGKCGYAVQPLNTCIKLGSDWDKKISSFGPDPCTVCILYETNNCQPVHFPSGSTSWDGSWPIKYPGDADGGMKGGSSELWWNDDVSSFKCSRTSC